jgi:CheY-like chemotaxis protein
MRPTAQAKQISFEVNLDRDAGLISGDADRLQQIIWNLLSNAIKFTPAGGRVEITLERIGPHVQITVADNGQGISAEFLPHVFERFRQADSSTTRKFGGLGLGLSIVRHLVELHGGLVQVDSAGDGHGATFTVMFPLLTESKEARQDSGPLEYSENASITDEPSLRGLRVLVVDDDNDSRAVIAEMLLHFGAEVLAVASAEDALNSIELWSPDVLLSDIEMPGEDGYSLLQKVRSKKSGSLIPAAALTAYSRSEDRVRALKSGYQIYLPKPVDPRELAVVVASLARTSEVNRLNSFSTEVIGK